MKKIYNILFLFLIISSGCDTFSGGIEEIDDGDGLDVTRTVSITNGDTAIRGKIGSKIQLEFEEINISAGASGYLWSSSDVGTVSINQNGVATAVGFGSVTIRIQSKSNLSIRDEIIVDVLETDVYYATDNVQNNTTVKPIGGAFDANAPNPAPTEVFNSTNVLKFTRGSNAFSFLRFTAPNKINFGSPDNTITFWAYIEDAGNNGLVAPNNQIRVIARNQAGTGAQQAATLTQEIIGFNKWHEYTFDLTDVLVSGTDYFQVNIFVAPADNNNNALGTIYYIDNVRGPNLN